MKILDILKLSALHGQQRLPRLEFFGKFLLAIAGVMSVSLFAEAAVAFSELALFIFLGIVPFIVLAYRLMFWRIKDITPNSTNSQIWFYVVGALVLKALVPGLGYVLLVLWPSAESQSADSDQELSSIKLALQK
jgi:hypothetical protein